MVEFYRDGFENIRPEVKAKLEYLLGQVGIAGVLEILSEIAEEYADCPSGLPKSVAVWNTAAAATKQLSEELFEQGIHQD